MCCNRLTRSLMLFAFCFSTIFLKPTPTSAVPTQDTEEIEDIESIESLADSKVSYNHRALVIVTELDQKGAPELKFLYQTLEKLTVTIPTELYDDYGYIERLTSRQATVQNLKSSLLNLNLNPNIHVIDMVLAVHGNEGTLSFVDERIKVQELRERILSEESEETLQNLRKKLRMIYNLSCFGKSHQEELFKLGFDAVIGSKAVNANAEIEYPSFLSRWSRGLSIQRALAPSNKPALLYLADEPLRKIGRAQNNFLKKVNSQKSIFGNAKITIRSPSI